MTKIMWKEKKKMRSNNITSLETAQNETAKKRRSQRFHSCFKRQTLSSMWCHHYRSINGAEALCQLTITAAPSTWHSSYIRYDMPHSKLYYTIVSYSVFVICEYIVLRQTRWEQFGGKSKNKRKPNMHNFNCGQKLSISGRPTTRRQRWRRWLTDTLSFCRRCHRCSILINQYHLQFVCMRMRHCVESNVTDCIMDDIACRTTNAKSTWSKFTDSICNYYFLSAVMTSNQADEYNWHYEWCGKLFKYTLFGAINLYNNPINSNLLI